MEIPHSRMATKMKTKKTDKTSIIVELPPDFNPHKRKLVERGLLWQFSGSESNFNMAKRYTSALIRIFYEIEKCDKCLIYFIGVKKQ